ncbi:MAG: dihydroorotate dehydrogenase electron transfer subunit [Clostridia bacterium]|nr:dihydroorotate dehydrogenase electron transfer subunit [Clostridia bacterium]MBQ2500736.1 dihydroorotate dehydrogenase electron transfer subunit [Clostridia bacterium]
MKQGFFKIESNEQLTSSVFKMTLLGDTDAITAPGQFVNIKLDGLFLRRPISVCDLYGNTLTLVYKTVGVGTEKLALMRSGDELDVLSGLGNGFDIYKAGERPLLVGGGVGVPPLLYLLKELKLEGAKPFVILGFNTKDEVILENDFRKYCDDVIVTTVDGSYGTKGFVTDALALCEGYTYAYTCGPEPMLKALHGALKTSGQFSFEERMGCGFGACMGCSCETITGYKRICREGPVLEKEEILWK